MEWLQHLPAAERQTFASEAIETLRASAETGDLTPFVELMEDWRNTAEIWSEPKLAAALQEPIDTQGYESPQAHR